MTDARQQLARWRVRDVMSAPIRTCPADLRLDQAARLMASERIHCLAVVEGGDHDEPPVVGILSDLDLIAALDGPAAGGTVAECARTPLESVSADAPLDTAVRQMHQSRAHHLVVVAGGSGRPVGVLSTLDVVAALAAPEGP